ncbi:spermidine synthase [Thermotomaculum hydrothermale]|uniref:Polyamine aminopropyltransferase n=1 Tax=Thermotomaculum hydrothermale TaxID=981385 RepID=A0A7R6PE47_9BACT|nr:polyamine aminopropyltransferase [Thermotomaculum hydrothermale]BBB32013.1 spermidine synthase [Thermotomaculum hydrothermale]
MNLWFTENQTDNLRLSFRVKNLVEFRKSKFQTLAVYDTVEYGRLFTLDDFVMLTEKDEFVYHEMISHIALSCHPKPENILVIGGGDGGTIREIERHSRVKNITLVEIDREVVEISKKHLPFVACGFDDERVSVIIDDGIEYIKNHKNKFDIIFIDSTDPVAFAEGLFHTDFYKFVFDALKKDGIMVAQTEYPFLKGDFIKEVFSSLKQVFPIVSPYLAFIPTYPTGMWSFAFASKKYHYINDLNPEFTKDFAEKLKYYTPEVHKAAFALPKFVKDLIE